MAFIIYICVLHPIKYIHILLLNYKNILLIYSHFNFKSHTPLAFWLL